MALKPIIAGPGFSQSSAASGGGGGSGGPIWTFDPSGTPSPSLGTFTASNTGINSTMTVSFARGPKDNGIGGWTQIFLNSNTIVATNSLGQSTVLIVTATSNDGSGNITVTTTPTGYTTGNWSGDYTISFVPNTFSTITGTTTPVTSITIVNGLITDIS